MEKEDEKGSNSRTDVSNSIQRYSVGLYQPVIDGLDMTLSAAYSKTRYDETDVNFLKKEDDRAMIYGIGLIKSIGKSSMITLNGAYTDNKSNIENKVYNKTTLSMGYIYNF